MSITINTQMTVNEQFETIWAAEMLVRSEQTGVLFPWPGTPMAAKVRQLNNMNDAKTALYALIDALSPTEAAAYGRYRAAILAEIRERG